MPAVLRMRSTLASSRSLLPFSTSRRTPSPISFKFPIRSPASSSTTRHGKADRPAVDGRSRMASGAGHGARDDWVLRALSAQVAAKAVQGLPSWMKDLKGGRDQRPLRGRCYQRACLIPYCCGRALMPIDSYFE